MRLYRALLHAYPASFRAEYGEEMCEIFRQRRRDASGPLTVAGLWVAAVFEVLGIAAAVHWEILRQDLRYAVRTLSRARAFALTTILLVAIGVGANTAAFSVTDFVLVRPLPYPDSARLVRVWQQEIGGYASMEFSPPNYRDWRRLATSFERTGAFTTSAVNLIARGEPERVDMAIVTADLLPALGVQPAIGRLFTEADDRDGAPATLILSDGLWRRAFGADPSILGTTVTLDDGAYTIVGVMPAHFSFPTRDEEMWLPARLPAEAFEDRNDNFLEVVARLTPGVALARAHAETSVIASRLRQQYPKENEHTAMRVNSFRDELSQQSRLLLVALSAAALCVLLIACANIANLLLVRALGRRREMAVRTAIGAGRERLIRQLSTESLLLALAGGVVGILLAAVAMPLLATLVPASFPSADTPAMDVRTMVFALALTAITGVIFGLAPILRSSGDVDPSGLREDIRSGGGRKERLRSALVVAEVVTSLVLLISSGLLMRAIWNVQSRDPGFRAEGVLTLETALPMPRYTETARRTAFYSRVLAGVQAIPGVSHAAYISSVPMVWRGGIWPVGIDGDLQERLAGHTASLRFTTPGFFATMGIPVRSGRDVSESDTADGPAVAVVSESFVRHYFPDKEPLGRHFKFAFQNRMVVGVVGDVRVRGLERESEPQVYVPYKQAPDNTLVFYAPKMLAIKASVPFEQLVPPVRAIVRQADPRQPISAIRPMSEIVAGDTASRAVQLRVLGVFAAMAILLAGVGIHGLLSFTVSQRTPEIGVRMALGAQRRDILAMILKRGAILTGLGLLPGLALAYAAGRSIQALLAGVAPADPLTFGAAILMTIGMAMAGTLLPTLRALRVDAARAMREQC
jgi:putative ABC transport system permease protein